MVGYMVAGAIIGEGGVGLVTQDRHELEYLARLGALLLLFSIGIEFSVQELVSLRRFLVIGGSLQMLLVAIPVVAVLMLFGMSRNSALLIGFAASLSSTVLVFKGLAEFGQVEASAGRRTIAILLFQDVALVPLILIVPLLTNTGTAPGWRELIVLLSKSGIFVCVTVIVRWIISRWAVELLSRMRSVELLTLFSLVLLGGACLGAHGLDLPPAIGALAAGVVISGSQISKQIDTIVLPFRESFAAVFFVTLGALLRPQVFFDEPLLLTFGLIGMLVVKMLAASLALRAVRVNWQTALGMGLGLAQLGEFSFLILLEGLRGDVISQVNYNRTLFIAIGTLIATPQLLATGLRWVQSADNESLGPSPAERLGIASALVVGLGPTGRQVATSLSTMGINVVVLDKSQVNVHEFALQGFHSVVGDARDKDVLERATASEMQSIIVCVPSDDVAIEIVREVRSINPTGRIVVRCRYVENVPAVHRAGANDIGCEETQSAIRLIELASRL